MQFSDAILKVLSTPPVCVDSRHQLIADKILVIKCIVKTEIGDQPAGAQKE